MPTIQRPVSLWRHRSFILLVLAYAISAFGDHLLEAAIIKEMGLEEGENTTRASAQIMFFFFLPYVLLGPIAGALADRLPRRAIMIVADLARCAICLTLPVYVGILPEKTGWPMMMPILGLGLFACFFNPARLSLVPQVVHDEHLTQANSVLGGLAPVASIVSFIVGSWLAVISTTLNFITDAGTFLVSAILVAFIGVLPQRVKQASVRRPVFEDVVKGFAYIKAHRHVWQLIIFTATFWTAAGAFSSIMTTVVFKWYDLGTEWWGPFKATLGAGMLLGAALLTVVAESSRAHYNIMVGLVGVGIMIMLFALTPVAWLGGIWAVGVGCCGVWILVSANTLLQRIVPNRTRGRVFGIVDLTNMCGMVGATFVLGIVNIPNLDAMIGYILFVLGGTLTIMGIVVWRHHIQRYPYKAWFTTLRWFNEVLCKFWYRLRRDGYCTVPLDGPCLVVSNHTSSLDPSFLFATCPNRVFGFYIADEYADPPVFRHLVKYLECIRVRRGEAEFGPIRQGLRHLRAGKAIGLFIEGRITRPDEEPDLQNGAALLALRSGATVVPVHVSGVYYNDSLLRPFFSRHRARIRYGTPVDLSEFSDPRNRGQLDQATARIWDAIQNLAPTDGQVYITD